jgi:hypothetical protein
MMDCERQESWTVGSRNKVTPSGGVCRAASLIYDCRAMLAEKILAMERL